MTEYSKRFCTLATNVVHAGAPAPNIEGAVITPLFQSANYLMADEQRYDAVRYIRLGNSPNHLTLQARMAAIESGEAALVTGSGMAAITSSILAFVRQGEHLLTQKTLYGGTQSFLDHDAPRIGLSYTPVDLRDPEGPTAWARALKPSSRMVLVETISNPLMEVGDLEAIVAFSREHELVTLIDNTFATPVNFRPLEHGFDLVVHSATKYLNGHSDIVAGVVVGSAAAIERVRGILVHLGAALDPHACFLLERGLKTLLLRVERQNANGLRLAGFLESRPEVRRVNYPGLVSDPGHRFARRLFSGYGGMLSFCVDSESRAERLLERLKIPLHAASLGSVESLIVRPARSSHLGQTSQELDRMGITDDLIRLSVGVEDAEELEADFERAFETS